MANDAALILGKTRTPYLIETPETHEAQGRHAAAADMRERHVARELFFSVGKHVYLGIEWADGKQSKPGKLCHPSTIRQGA